MTPTMRCVLLGCAGVGLMAVSGGFFSVASTQNADSALPVVASASVPFYPRTALLAHIEGVVKVRVTTDGERTSAANAESGPPMLARAAEQNLRSWQFEEHAPTTFVATFQYRIDEPGLCNVGNSTVVMHMPSDVQVSAQGVHTCDPVSPIRSQQDR